MGKNRIKFFLKEIEECGYVIEPILEIKSNEHQKEVKENEKKEFSYQIRMKCYSPLFFNMYFELIEENIVNVTMWGIIRTQSTDFKGDRSDIHDFLSLSYAILLKKISGISTSLHTEEGFFPGESNIHSRIITFERYGLSNAFLDKKVSKIIMDILLHSIMIVGILENLFELFKGYHYDDIYESFWVEKCFGNIFNLKDEDKLDLPYNAIGRRDPDVKWFYYEPLGVSIFHSDEQISKMKKLLKVNETSEIDGVESKFIKTGNTINAVKYETIDLLNDLLKDLDTTAQLKLDICEQVVQNELFCIENKVFMFGKKYLICVDDICSNEVVKREKRLLKKRQQLENKILYENFNFKWAEKINPAKFEDLIRELMNNEENVSRVRQVGVTNEPDGGRDLMVDFSFIDKRSPFKPEVSPYIKKKIIVQCKAYQKNVGKRDVTDIRDTIDHFCADGYFLVTSSNITRSLHDYLSSLKDRTNLYIDWWGRSEIEDRLRKNPEIVERYSDIVKILS